MAVEMVLRNPAVTVMEAATTELTPWNPVPAVTASPRSIVAVMTVITASLQSTVVPVTAAVATIGPTPENTVVTTETDHRSTVITITRDPWSARVTAVTDHRSTTMAVAPDPWNTVVTNASFQVSSRGGDYLPSANAGDWWQKTPPGHPRVISTPLPKDKDKCKALQQEVNQLLKNAVEKVTPGQIAFHSPFFLTTKKSGDWRPILNLKKLSNSSSHLRSRWSR